MTRQMRVERTADEGRQRRLDAMARPQVLGLARLGGTPAGGAPCVLQADRLERSAVTAFATAPVPAVPAPAPVTSLVVLEAKAEATDARERLAAIEVLRQGTLPRPDAIALLKRIAARETDYKVLFAAAVALTRLRGDVDAIMDVMAVEQAREAGRINDVRALYMLRRHVAR